MAKNFVTLINRRNRADIRMMKSDHHRPSQPKGDSMLHK